MEDRDRLEREREANSRIVDSFAVLERERPYIGIWDTRLSALTTDRNKDFYLHTERGRSKGIKTIYVRVLECLRVREREKKKRYSSFVLILLWTCGKTTGEKREEKKSKVQNHYYERRLEARSEKVDKAASVA